MSEHIKKEDRKKIMFIGDAIIGVSGVANVIKDIIVGTAHHYNYITVGVSLDKDKKGQKFNLCEAVNKEAGINDSDVTMVAWDVYDDVDFLKQVIAAELPDAIVFITDPRYYQRLFGIAHEIQYGSVAGGKKIPMSYIQIWDEFPPPFYNRAAWSSVNMSLCISKQTVLMNKIVLGDRVDKTMLRYFPHGVNINKFKPVAKDDLEIKQLAKDLFKGREYEFVLFFNSRNIMRKNIPTALMAFRSFLDKVPQESADKCFFVLHTQPVDSNGTDLYAVVETLFGDRKEQVVFDTAVCVPEQLNLRYALADATVLISEAEGFGLSGLESMAAGTPIIVNMTGGMQDYCNIKDENGEWFTPNEKVWSNHNKTYTDMGSWVYPVWPSTLTLIGSVPTPYIFSSRCDFKDVAEAMHKVYTDDVDKRKSAGLEAREWIQKKEVGMTAGLMAENFIYYIDDMMANWEPIDRYTVIPIDGTETLSHTELPQYLFSNH